jgi:hypothetical protein
MSFDPENVKRYLEYPGPGVTSGVVREEDYDALLELYRASQRAVAHGLEVME